MKTLLLSLSFLVTFSLFAQTPYTPTAENLKAREEFRDGSLVSFFIGGSIACWLPGNGR